MAVSQSLSVTEVANSVNVANNTSQVRILWTSTQTNDSHNLNSKTAYYYVSINGGAESTYSVTYTLPLKTTTTIVDKTITVPHKDDGSATVKVRTWMSTGISAGVVEKSQTTTLTTIARASIPSCITSPNNTRDVGNFGDTIKIHMNSKSSSFRHTVQYFFGNTKKTCIAEETGKEATGIITSILWKIPLDLINELAPGDKDGWGSIVVETYNGTKLVGSRACEFSVKVPNIEATKPKVTMALNPVGSLPSAFEGLYIQGLTKVKATLSATGKYGATISSYLMKVDGGSYNSSAAYTSSYLTSLGEKTVVGYATDSREHTGETSQTIDVIPYNNPRLENSSAVRCDKNGNPSESGTYLKISGKRVYSPCTSNGEQKNFCEIQYRYSQDGGVSYSQWTPILNRTNLSSDEVVTAPLLGGTLSVETSYIVHIRAIDDIGRYAESYISIPTEKVYWHRDGARNALGLGKYNERDNAVDSAWDFYMNGKKVTGLPTPTDDTDAVPLGLLGDHITERGTNGIWTYEKRASGIAKCWAKIPYTVDLKDINVRSDVTLNNSFPFTFAETPFCNCTLSNQVNWNHVLSSCDFTTSQISKFSVYRLGAGVNITASGTADIRVIGKFKQ